MKNNGLFSALFLSSLKEQVALTNLAQGRMASLAQTWSKRDHGNSERLWDTFMKQALSYLLFVPPGEPWSETIYPLYQDYSFSNPIAVLCLVDTGWDIDETAIGRFWPGKLIGELKRQQLNWGILSDGARWRLYSTKTSKPYEDFVELNLFEALEQNDEAEYALFERFFHRDSFVADLPAEATAQAGDTEDTEENGGEESAGIYKCRLDHDRDQSEQTLEQNVKAPFLAQVDEVLRYICNGFIFDTQRSGEEYTEEERAEIFESAVKLIYRCLFLFYAEARRLLPTDPEKADLYQRHSIQALCLEAHKFRWGKRRDTDQYDLWKHLKGLISAVNDGDPEYGIMGYNGGLFDDEEERFLGRHQLRNDFLSRALYLLAFVEPFDNEPDDEYSIPYEDLEVRHLGELYETILEFMVQLADADRIRRRTKKSVEILLASQTTKKAGDTLIKKGDVYFGESALERKQSGSYYTPESLVRFLNQKTIVQPLGETFEGKYRQRFNDLLEQTTNAHDAGTRRGAAQSAAVLVERFAEEELLKFKVCDLAMGSGHFLVDAANQMAGLVVALLAEVPHVEGMTVSVTSRPNDWRRLITRHCIYGVDLNPLAVNLAKLSLWLNCFATHHRLTFLDHHVRCGNSLIGIRSLKQLATIPERKKESQKKKNQLRLGFDFDDLSGILEEAAKSVASITRIDEDDTDKQKAVLDEALETTSRLRSLADLCTAYLMDPDIPADDYKEIFERLAKGKSVAGTLNPSLTETLESVEAYREWHCFYHWPLEFPDVFGPDAVGGFSATVGNPPWDTVLPNSQEFFSAYDPKFRSYKKQQAKRIAQSLMKDNPTIAKKWEEYGNKFTQQITYFKEPINYRSIGKIHINTYKLFLEHFFSSLCPGGQMGIVVPSGIYTDQGCQPLRKLFFNHSKVAFLYCFENRRAVFNIHRMFKFVLFGTRKNGRTDRFRCTFMEHDPDRLTIIDTNAMQLTFEQIKKLSPDTLSIMEFDNQIEIDIATSIYKDRPLLGDYLNVNYHSAFQDEFNITHDTELFITEEESTELDVTPLWEGKQIWILTNEFASPTRFMLKVNAKIKPTTQQTRVVYRSVASNTNERTFIPAIVPATFPTGNSVDACPLPPSVAIKIAVITGTFVIDWILRKKVTTNLNKFITAQLPILDILKTEGSHIFELLLAIGSRLACTSSIFSEIWSTCYSEKWGMPEFWYDSNAPIDIYGPAHEQKIRRRLRDEARGLTLEWIPHCGVHDRLPDKRDTGDRAQLRAEIDAYVAHLYGLSRDDFAYILDTFPVLKKKEEKAFGEFMSKRKCLEEYDRIAKIL